MRLCNWTAWWSVVWMRSIWPMWDSLWRRIWTRCPLMWMHSYSNALPSLSRWWRTRFADLWMHSTCHWSRLRRWMSVQLCTIIFPIQLWMRLRCNVPRRIFTWWEPLWLLWKHHRGANKWVETNNISHSH